MELRSFISSLPELGEGQIYYLTLLSRSKYYNGDRNIPDKYGVKRFTSTKKNLFNNISLLDIKGDYRYHGDGTIIPEETLSLYMYVNPRSERDSIKNIFLKLFDVQYTNKKLKGGLITQAMNSLSTSQATKDYVGFDFDVSEDMDKENLKGYLQCNLELILPRGSYDLVETRGGFHILVKPKLIDPRGPNKLWHSKLNNFTGRDINGDMMVPIPGCIQGGFVPKFITD